MAKLQTTNGETSVSKAARDMAVNEVFTTKGYKGAGFYIRAVPCGLLKKSRTVNDLTTKRDEVMVFNTANGMVGFIPGGMAVDVVESAVLVVR